MQFTSPPNPQEFNRTRMGAGAAGATRQSSRRIGRIRIKYAAPNGVDLRILKKAFGPRWVGGAMAACPDDVPWQRVINSQGRISERPGAEKQRMLLEGEGIVFVKDKVDLKEIWLARPQ